MAKRGGFPGGGGMGNMGAMMKQAQKMQAELAKAQDEIKDMEYEATAGGGMVKVGGHGRHGASRASSSTRRRWTPRTWSCSRTWCVAAVNEALRGMSDVSAQRLNSVTGGIEHPRPDVGAGSSHVRSAVHPEAPRRAGAPARHRPEVGAAHRLLDTQHRQGHGAAPVRGHRGSEGPGALLPAVLQLRRGRPVRDMPGRPGATRASSAWSASRATFRPSSARLCSRAFTMCWAAPCRPWRASARTTCASPSS